MSKSILHSIVAFHENFNDIKLDDGEVLKIKDIENKIESIELTKLDNNNNKRYKFALRKIEISKIDKKNIIDISLSNK